MNLAEIIRKSQNFYQTEKVPNNYKCYPRSVILNNSVAIWNFAAQSRWSCLPQAERLILTPLACSVHPCSSVNSWDQGKSGSLLGLALGFRGLSTSYRLIPSKRNQAMVLTSLWAFVVWSSELHQPLSLIGFYLTAWCRNCATIKHCNIWESPCWN